MKTMNRDFSLTIGKPCSEKFTVFRPTEAGGFCASCQKEVVDFTGMSDQAIVRHFQEGTKRTCGYFRASQLKTYSEAIPPQRRARFSFLGASLISFSVLSLAGLPGSKAQQPAPAPLAHALQPGNSPQASEEARKNLNSGGISVEGVVVAEDGEPLLGVCIVVKGVEMGTFTNEEGRFKFSHPLQAGDVLTFSYIGFVSEEFVLNNHSPQVITMTLKSADCMLMGEVSVNEVYQSRRSFWQRLTGAFR